MKISRAIRNASDVYFGHFEATLKFWVVEACLTMICLAPALLVFEESLKWGALWVIPMWILIMLPARMNAAAAMRDALRGGSLFSRRLADCSDYREKLFFALRRTGFLLLWSLPAIFMAWQIREHYSGQMDVFTLMRMIRNQFGGGDLFTGVFVVLGIVAATLLLIAAGCAFHSGARHAYAQGDPAVVNGHHGKVILTWLCALLSILPLLVSVIIVVFRYLPVLQDPAGLLMDTVQLPSTRGTLIILGVGVVLTLPLLPLRSLISAAYVNGLEEERQKA